jgi:hypothetical protein
MGASDMTKTSYPKTKDERAKLYLHCMLEIKERLAAMDTILLAPMRPLFKHESCLLQLRHICELIAIACLAAQGDFETQRAFTEEYSPPKIFSALRKLYEHFFPQPCDYRYEPGDPGQHYLTASNNPDAYRERDITNLWNQAGDHLHRASVKKYLATTFNPPPSLTRIERHMKGIRSLLQTHAISVQHGETQPVLLQVMLEDPGGAMHAAFLHLDPEQGTMTVEQWRGEVT